MLRRRAVEVDTAGTGCEAGYYGPSCTHACTCNPIGGKCDDGRTGLSCPAPSCSLFCFFFSFLLLLFLYFFFFCIFFVYFSLLRRLPSLAPSSLSNTKVGCFPFSTYSNWGCTRYSRVRLRLRVGVRVDVRVRVHVNAQATEHAWQDRASQNGGARTAIGAL
jgi:hypothetical protein